MGADEWGPLRRSWGCVRYGALVSEDWDAPEVFDPEGASPFVMVPREWAERGWEEQAYGYAMADLFCQRYGWQALVRVLSNLDAAVGGFVEEERTAD